MISRLAPLILLAAPLAFGQPSQPDQRPSLEWRSGWFNRYYPRRASPVLFANSSRIGKLIRAGNLYLSLDDAVALAIENNLDVELQRFTPAFAGTDLLRAKGGGTLRGIPLTVSEMPAGVGGPGSPLLNVAATGTVSPNSNIVTAVPDVLPVSGASSNLSLLGSNQLSSGTAIPLFDPSIGGTLNWLHQDAPQANFSTYGVPTFSGHNTTGILGFNQGFAAGTQVSGSFNAINLNSNSSRLNYNPYTNSTLGLNFVQPLFRGFGTRVNRRFIRMAGNSEKIAGLVFRQQLISAAAGVIRLYYDLVSLNEDLGVRRQTVALAEQLQDNNRQQVEQGTLPPIELARAQAFVAAARQDLANAEGFVAQQELILKSVLSKRGVADPQIEPVHIIPTDPITIPAGDEVRPVQDLVEEAHRNRPDLEAARLQLENSQISLEGARNALLPQIDLVGTASVAGLKGQGNSYATGLAPTIDPNTIGGFWGTMSQIFHRDYPLYGVGIQVTLPLKNRVAQSDYARDDLQVRQSEVRRQQLENQVSLEIENALVTMRRARAALDAAAESRRLQEQALSMERERYSVGLSTNFLIMQYQSYLAQARSTEVAARSTYVKARNALERATGETLANHNISVDEAYRGQLSRP